DRPGDFHRSPPGIGFTCRSEAAMTRWPSGIRRRSPLRSCEQSDIVPASPPVSGPWSVLRGPEPRGPRARPRIGGRHVLVWLGPLLGHFGEDDTVHAGGSWGGPPTPRRKATVSP